VATPQAKRYSSNKGKKMALTKQQIDIYRNMPAGDKLALAAEFNQAARELKRCFLKMHHPEWSEQQLQREVKKIFLYASN